MVKELYQITSEEVSLSVNDGRIDSVRQKNITRSGCRVYDGAHLGVAGALGEPTAQTWADAQAALALGIPYPWAPEEDAVRSRTLGDWQNPQDFLEQAEDVLETLRREFPGFVLSNKISLNRDTVRLSNDRGLHLTDTQVVAESALIVKDKSSSNIYDSFLPFKGRRLDTAQLLAIGRELLSAHSRPVPMPEKNLPVILDAGMVSGLVAEYLHGEKLAKGASLLSGKVGQALFSPRLTLYSSRDEESDCPFFDAEGVTLPDDLFAVIENGVLRCGLADKRVAATYGVPRTASSSGGYADAPTLGTGRLRLAATDTLENLLAGEDGIYILIASGGDITAAGDYATPVQTAYLYHDGHLVGRLPEFGFSGNLFDLLGSGYRGRSACRFLDSPDYAVLEGTLTR